MKKLSPRFFYLLSFIEGGMMLVTELASAQKIAVFFGSSLYVWLMVLCITMIGLAIGYYLASYLLQKYSSSPLQDKLKFLAHLFFLLSIGLAIWKFNNGFALMLIQSQTGLIASVLIDGFLLLIIPMFTYGALTTLLMEVTKNLSDEKSVYGKILAASTLGSVFLALIAVLWTFPYFGIQGTINGLSILSLCLAFILYAFKWWIFLIPLIVLLLPAKNIRKNILYQKEGVFSSVLVIDENLTRYLMVNYIIQSFVDVAHQKTLRYAEIIDSIGKIQKWKNKKSLILGMGGGIIANKLAEQQVHVTGVEIDPRIITCAQKYFYLNEKIKIICEDAQWWLQKDTTHYDIIIIDLFNGEAPPSYLFTYENFLQIKKLLKDKNSLIIINWYGYYSGTTGKGTRVLVHTLAKAGYQTSLVPTNQTESTSNLLIFASQEKTALPPNKVLLEPEKIIHTADNNILNVLNAEMNYKWRRDYLKFIEHWWK